MLTFYTQVIREMEATIQFKKYRTMRSRYGEGLDLSGETERLKKVVQDLMKNK